MVSSATTGPPEARASSTSGAIRTSSLTGEGSHGCDAARGGGDRLLGPADEPARGEGVSRARRVDDVGRLGRELRLLPVPPDERAAGAALHDDGGRLDLADELELVLVPEDRVRPQLGEHLAKARDPELLDRARPGEVDADRRALPAREVDGRAGRVADREARQAVAGNVERLAARTRRVELGRRERRSDPAVGQHRAPALRVGERDDGAGPGLDLRAGELDAAGGELAGEQAAGGISGSLAHEARLPAERGHPGGHVRRLAAGSDAGSAVGVRVRHDRPVHAHDHVEQQVADRADHASEPRLRSWTASAEDGSAPS